MRSRTFPALCRRPRSGILMSTTTIAAVLLIATIGQPTPPAGADDGWSAEETYFVYLLNQARWHPEAVSTAAGLPPETFLPQPPLAVNASLAASAQARSNEMAAHNYFAHQSPVTGQWPNAVARAHGYELPGWWPDAANNIESLHKGSPDPARVLQSFIESPNHRNHVMGQGWFETHREIGVGLAPAARVWSIHTASRDRASLFLTGVVYRDSNGNGGMDLLEGLAGVTVTVDGRAVTTNAGGGWAIPTTAGIHQVAASGGSFGSTAVTVEVDAFNVQVDFIVGGARSGEPRTQVRAYSLCMGRQPTILGTSDDDAISGTSGPDVIHGLGGDDIIYGLGGDDVICGGPGDDQLYGGDGDDHLQGGGGRDLLSGGAGSNVLRGQSDLDTIAEGPGDDLLLLR
jgi:uncharacterized protein YkwD